MRHLAAIVTTLLLATGAAHAFSSVPGHVDITVKAKTKTVNGVKCVVGCRVSFVAKNPSGSFVAGHSSARETRPTIWTPAGAKALRDGPGREATVEEGKFTGVVWGQLLPIPELNTAYPGHVDIDYAKHGVKSGDRLTLITGWNYSGASSAHVYGAVTNYSEGNEFTAP